MSEMIIDLDHPVAEEPDEPIARYPYWRQLTVAALAALICFATLARSDVASPEPVRLVSYIDGLAEALMLHEGMVIFPRQQPGLVAYSADGVKRWELAPDTRNSELYPQPLGDLLLLTAYEPGPEGDTPYSMAVDIKTGQQVWSSNGFVTIVGRFFASIGIDQSIEVIDPVTLKQVFRLPAQRAVNLDPEDEAVVAMSRDGLISVYRLPDGALEHAPVKVDVPDGLEVFLNIRFNEIWVDTMEYLGSGIAAYPGPVTRVSINRKTLELQYNVVEDAGVADRDCGPVVCRQRIDSTSGSEIEVVRPDGMPLWQVKDGMWAEWVNEGLLLTFGPSAVGLADPFDGSIQVNLDGWNVVPRAWSARSGPLLLSRLSKNRLHLAVVGERGLQPLGSIPHVPKDCQYEWPFIVCATQFNQIGVWRLAQTR